MKGIILAGGTGSRLYPLTFSTSKQLLPVYNKPMIYYPLTTLMLAGIQEVMIITTLQDQPDFENLLSDGSQWGMRFTYAVQEKPNGIAEALIIAEDFISDDSVLLILGDNIFYSEGLSTYLTELVKPGANCKLFGCYVNDPERYCVITYEEQEVVTSGNRNEVQVTKLTEKPNKPDSNYVIPGLYFYTDASQAVNIVKNMKPSLRGELEITDLNQIYLDADELDVTFLGRGVAWFDAGTHDSLLEASNFVYTVESRQGLLIASPDEIAYRKGWINSSHLEMNLKLLGKSTYGQYLSRILSSNYLSL